MVGPHHKGATAAINARLRRIRGQGVERAAFVVRTDEPTYQVRLVKMGWCPQDASG